MMPPTQDTRKLWEEIKRLGMSINYLRSKIEARAVPFHATTVLTDHIGEYTGSHGVVLDSSVTVPAINTTSNYSKNGTTGYLFVPLAAPLTSTVFDGDSFSSTAKTQIDLSDSFSAPVGIKAVLVGIRINDSGSAGTDCWLILSPNSTAGSGITLSCFPVNDALSRYESIVPCDTQGDIYYQIQASGTGTFDLLLRIWGYWI